MALFHREPDLSTATLAEFTAEVERRGYRLISAESMEEFDRMTVADPALLAEIRAGLQSIPGLCREVAEKDAEVVALRVQLTRAHAAQWWATQGYLDQKWGAMALTRTEAP